MNRGSTWIILAPLSSLARNTLQALAPSVGIVALFLFLVSTAATPPPIHSLHRLAGGFVPWRGALIYLIGLPAFFIALTFLTSQNSHQPAPGLADIRQNLLVLAVFFVLTLAATTLIYHRAWEKITPFEPPHGAASSPGTTRRC